MVLLGGSSPLLPVVPRASCSSEKFKRLVEFWEIKEWSLLKKGRIVREKIPKPKPFSSSFTSSSFNRILLF